MTFLGRSTKGRLFHVAAWEQGGLVRWLCGASTRHADPQRVPLPEDGLFGGMDSGQVCRSCHRRHNDRATQRIEGRVRAERRRERSVSRLCAELSILVERAVHQGFTERPGQSPSHADHAFALAEQLRREGHWQALRDHLLSDTQRKEARS